jgi:hypothetical protein
LAVKPETWSLPKKSPVHNGQGSVQAKERKT